MMLKNIVSKLILNKDLSNSELNFLFNKIIPKELRDAAEVEPLILNKQWYFYAQFDAEDILREDLDAVILNCYEAGKPVEEFFSKLIKRN